MSDGIRSRERRRSGLLRKVRRTRSGRIQNPPFGTLRPDFRKLDLRPQWHRRKNAPRQRASPYRKPEFQALGEMRIPRTLTANPRIPCGDGRSENRAFRLSAENPGSLRFAFGSEPSHCRAPHRGCGRRGNLERRDRTRTRFLSAEFPGRFAPRPRFDVPQLEKPSAPSDT